MKTKLDKFTIIVTLYVVLLIISNLMATKLTTILGMTLPSAVLAYPFCFMTADVLVEIWGYDTTKRVIWLGFFMNLLLVILTNLGIYMPYPSFWDGQIHYSYIFGAVPRIVLGSFAGYLLGELVNAWTFYIIRKLTGDKALYVRTIGSTTVGQIVDTIAFFGIAFYGTMPNHALLVMMLTQYLFKVAIEICLGTPMAYGLVKWVKRS